MIQVLRHFQQFFNHIAMVFEYDRELNAHFKRARVFNEYPQHIFFAEKEKHTGIFKLKKAPYLEL